MAQTTLTGNLAKDAGGRYFSGPIDPATGEGRAHHGVQVSGDYYAGAVALYDATGVPLLVRRLAADNLALPTAPDVLATLLGYDGSTLDLLRTYPAAGGQLSSNAGVLSAGLVISSGVNLFAPVGHVPGDSTATNLLWVPTTAAQEQFNGTSWERVRGNNAGTLLASAARTATTNSADQTNYSGRGVRVRLKVTVNPGGAETLTVNITWKDPITGDYLTVATSGAQAFGGGAGDYVLDVYPGIGAAANEIDAVASVLLGRTYRASVVHSASGSWTYSLAYDSGL